MDRLVAGEGEGSLAEMFRLALTDFPQWSPTALSIDPPIVQACRYATAWAPRVHPVNTAVCICVHVHVHMHMHMHTCICTCICTCSSRTCSARPRQKS